MPEKVMIDGHELCLDMHPKAKTVCDPFMGTGTTGVACVQSGRRFIGIERERLEAAA